MSLALLLARQLRHRPWPTLLLALTIAVASALATAVPRLSSDLADRQLAQRVAALSAVQGDVSGHWQPSPAIAAEGPWPGYEEAMEEIRAAQPEPLGSLLAPAQFVARYPTTESFAPPADTGFFAVTLTAYADPRFADHADLVDGAWPRLGGDPELVEVVVLASAAERAGWTVGQQLGKSFRIVGTYRPKDEANVRWEHVELGRRYLELVDPDRGVEFSAAVFVDPALVGGTTTAPEAVLMGAVFSIDAWFRLDASAVADVDVAALTAQLTALLANPWVVHAPTEDEPATEEVRLASELGAVLTRVEGEQRGSRALVAASAAGPLGVAAALVVLAARLVADRRRATLTLTSARGLSPRQQRRLAAAEGALVGLPASVAGGVVAWAATPGGVPGAVAWLAVALLAAVPAAALAWQTVPRAGRRDLTPRGGRARLVAEALVLVAGVAAAWRLLGRADGGPGIDLLGASAPPLLALAGCLAVLRAYPFPLRWLHGLLRPRRGLTGFLGSARALREPAGGAIPVLAVALGSALALSSALLLGTLAHDTERAVWERTGSSLQVSGPRITAETAERIGAVDGVAAVARISEGGSSVRLATEEGEAHVRVWLADRSLLDAYAVAFDSPPVPASLFGGGEPAPVVVGGEVPDAPSGTLDQLGPVHRVARLDVLPGVLPGLGWVLVDAERWPGGDAAKSTLALVALADDADPAAVTAEIRGMLKNARIAAAADELDQLRDSPTVSGLTAIFALLAAATSCLLALAVAAAQLLGSESRRGLAAVLNTLGMPRGSLRALTAWELGPVIVVALGFGLALGVGIAALLVRAVDLAALTGGATAAALVVDPATVGAVVGGLLAVAGATIAVSSALAGRADAAQQLRIGEDR